MSIADDKRFQELADAHGAAAADARALGGDLGSAGEYAAAEEALVAYVDAQLEECRAAGARLVNDALERQHEKINRMESALQEIRRAGQTCALSPGIALSAIADLADLGLK